MLGDSGASAVAGRQHGGTILVVDDEETVRAVARKILLREGFDVLVAEDGREGLRIFGENPDAINVVLLDMAMPHMGGEETFREMRRIRPEVRVVLSSGYNEAEVTDRFAGKGLAGFIQKPYRPTELVAKLRDVLGRAAKSPPGSLCPAWEHPPAKRHKPTV